MSRAFLVLLFAAVPLGHSALMFQECEGPQRECPPDTRCILLPLSQNATAYCVPPRTIPEPYKCPTKLESECCSHNDCSGREAVCTPVQACTGPITRPTRRNLCNADECSV
eukprot:Sspe_Gene.83292::Locus_54630_Transcript_1_1_Confidence_1.000_Length_399::g.83292::m.83292